LSIEKSKKKIKKFLAVDLT
jgi:hypothetical protein